MLPLTSAELDRVAALARLELTEEERDRLLGELESVLGHLDVLRRADLSDAPAPGDAGSAAPLRRDEIAFDPLQRPLAELAPEWADGFFLLPRIPAFGGE